jgi:polar amino acid transport system substrate-binding protein
MRKIMAILVAMVCLSAFAGTSLGEGLTLKEGVLQVGMEIGYPPMEYLAEDGVTNTGFDVDFANELASRLGLKLEIVDTAWDGIFASLDSSRYDVIISAVSITPARQENYNLTKPYIANKLVLVTAKDLPIKSPDDLAGYKVAVQTETTADEFMKAKMAAGLAVNESDYFVYDKIIQCFEELKLGRADAVLVDSVVAAYYIGTDKDKFSIVWENDTAEPMGLCLKKGNDALTQKIEETIDTMYADGKMTEIAMKYFGMDTTAGVR